MIKKKFFATIYILLQSIVAVCAQQAAEFDVPFNFPLYLSGNFAELRSNHFHAGLDFKTQGVEGKPISVIADGYIVRAKVQVGGYGRALYVMHDNGYMTVYGHLQKFPSGVERAVRERQYADECFAVDMEFSPELFPVKRGEVLAHAGNSGYSFGPHLHFEIRSADGEELYNPLSVYSPKISDTRPPVAQAVALYPMAGRGVVDGSASSHVRKVQNGMVADTLAAWGYVGFGLKGLDYMSGTTNKYGIYEIELYVDDSLRFAARMDNFSYAENRLINAWADYDRWASGEGWFLRSYLLPNNPLRMISADAAGGWVNISEERLYNVEYRLRDYHGNTAVYPFVVMGKPCDIPAVEHTGGYMLRWFLENDVRVPGCRLVVPRGVLFDDCYMKLVVDDSHPSPIYSLADAPVPLWRAARITLDIPVSLLPFADKCYVERVQGAKRSSVGGTVEGNAVSADILLLDDYAVAVDTVAPRVSAVNEKQWARNGRAVFAVADKHTGINTFRGTIDGKFVLFEYSSKNGRITCDFKKERVARGKHALRLEVTDRVGNRTVLERNIMY
ncbi:MAG: peptidoglycan DD-metalloendopeptidase family protein [Bacteroidaceae bacterium]|nr:peptidoglycan DD-metalloendopeptidase family protein [Bacteroidaceae bacterium]